MTGRIIHIESAAPPKPALGQPCNGCGVCCLLEPCPLGALLSGRRHGACDAVRWEANMQVYRCGALVAPAQIMDAALPQWLQRPGRIVARVLPRLAQRWIAADTGCDCSLETIKA